MIQFINLVKEYIDNFPHLASIRTQCKVLNLDMDTYIRVGVGREEGNIYPSIQKLNASMIVHHQSGISEENEYCLLTPQLFDDKRSTVYERSKFSKW